MTGILSPEFRLAAACCRWPSSEARSRAIAAAMDHGIDWERFLRVAQRHRIEGLASEALRHEQTDVPKPIAAELAAASAGIAQENLMHAGASLRLRAAFAEASIPILFVKGVTLSILAYGTLSLKKARDIDVLVAPRSAAAAFEILRAAGYRLRDDAGGDAALILAAAAKETVWEGPGGILVELHTALVDNVMMLPGVGLGSKTQEVAVAPGKTLPTLRKDELFGYLCVHGATHAWSRLKWLADVAALIASDDGAEIERLYDESVALGAGRSAAQALLLCSELLGTELPDRLAGKLSADPGTRWLVRVAMRSMAGAHAERELDETVLGTLPIHFSHFLLQRGTRYKLSELKRKAAGRPGAATAPLPPVLSFLRPLLAVPLWLRARAQERIRR